MSDWLTISPEALEEAERSLQFQLVVPDTARSDRSGEGHRWTECVDIESVDHTIEPDKARRYVEVAIRINGETSHPANIGKAFSKRFYINDKVLSKEETGEGQVRMTKRSLAVVGQLVRAAGGEVPSQGMDQEFANMYLSIGSPLVGQKAWIEVYQHPRSKDPSRIDIDIDRFLPYE